MKAVTDWYILYFASIWNEFALENPLEFDRISSEIALLSHQEMKINKK